MFMNGIGVCNAVDLVLPKLFAAQPRTPIGLAAFANYRCCETSTMFNRNLPVQKVYSLPTFAIYWRESQYALRRVD
jgi:hypothetical protein